MFWKTYDLHAPARPVLRGNTNKRNIIRNTEFWKKAYFILPPKQFISINQKHFNQIQVVTNEITIITCKLKFTAITAFKNINSLYKGSVLDAIHQNDPVIVSPPTHKYTSIIAESNHLINHFKAFLSPKWNTWNIAFITLWPTRSKSS